MGNNTRYPSLDGAGGREVAKFTKRDTILDTCKAGGIGALFGLNLVLVRNSLSPSRTVTGGLRGHIGAAAVFALVGSAYTFGDAVSANIRERETPLNGATGGALAGAVLGASLKGFGKRSIAKSFGGAFLLGLTAATFQWGFDRGHDHSVNSVTSTKQEINEEHPRQGFWELVHRRPLSQTIEELGDLAKQFVKE